jgi:uncharacterized protein YodC (DUF2158 family)
MAKSNQIEVGSVVRLKSGGPKLVVESLGITAQVVWFNEVNGHLMKASVYVQALSLVRGN